MVQSDNNSLLKIALLLYSWCCMPAKAEETWRFVTLADWHGAEHFVLNPINHVNDLLLPRHALTVKRIKTFKHIKDNYGGDFVLVPGDTNGGLWHLDKFLGLLNVTTAEEAVMKAGKRCYEGMKFVFEQAGYSKLIVAIGDHEIGDNSWPKRRLKSDLLPQFRQVFFQEFNSGPNGQFLYGDRIGKADSRPLETIFDKTSYAYQHKNALFITVDAYQPLSFDFIDKKKGLGGEGSVTCDVKGRHLDWFREVLSEARQDPTINHIFVQAHPPILQPVRKIRSTGQFMDGAENSAFFKAMRDFEVDVYFAGEVHANTATKDNGSTLVQIVSTGLGIQNFVTVDVSDTIINITQYKEVGLKARHNDNYEFYGQYIIDKSGKETSFKSTGSLKYLSRKREMISLSFDETVPLSKRPVPAMKHDDIRKTLVQRKITVQGVECFDSLPNRGEFGQQYDAQFANLGFSKGVKGKAAVFDTSSRVAIFALGPHSAGLKVSYALWFRTEASRRKQVLLHFGERLTHTGYSKLPIFSLTLDEGVPTLYAGANMKLVAATTGNVTLADNQWHHLAVAMPRNSCRLSEVQLFIDGMTVATYAEGKDDFLFLTTTGSMSIGGFGHSDEKMNLRLLPTHQPYLGLLDEVYVWANSLSSEKVAQLAERPSYDNTPTMGPTGHQPTVAVNGNDPQDVSTPKKRLFTLHAKHKCVGSSFHTFNLTPKLCKKQCRKSVSCSGFDVERVKKTRAYVCRIYTVKPVRPGLRHETSFCGIKNDD